MINFIKYDLKTNKNYILTIMLIQSIVLGLAVLAKFFSPIHLILGNKAVTDVLLIASIIFFLGINMTFAINFIYKDYFTKRAMLTFSLPISVREIVLGKVLGISIFYLLSGTLLTLSLYFLGYKIGTDFIYYLVFGLLLINVISLCLNLNMAKSRFTKTISWLSMLVTLLAVIIPILLLTSFFALVLIDGKMVRTSGMGLAFIFPFAIGDESLYKIITPFIYYIFASVILFRINVTYIEKNLDLA